MIDQPQQSEVIRSELLSAVACTIEDEPHGILNFRYGEDRKAVSFAITKSQVERLRDDLSDILEFSPVMDEKS